MNRDDVLKILIIGYGSMGRRHLKNLVQILEGKHQIDVLRRTISQTEKLETGMSGVRFVDAVDELSPFYDAIFITNPTSLHFSTLQKMNGLSNTFFIEKPVFVTGEENVKTLDNAHKKYYVAAPLRYSNVIQWLKSNIDFSTVYSMRAISSSYLPEWRPGQDYRDTYSAHKDMGGGVSIDLIHEWDYITYLAGFPNRVKSAICKKSNLEIDSDDIAVYIAEYDDMLVEIHLDYFGRAPVRQIELFTDNDTIVADLIEQKITWLKSERVLELSEDRDSYQKKELIHFLDIQSGKIESDNTIEEACRVLRIARGIE